MTSLVDSMAHLGDPRVAQPSELLRRAREAGVGVVVEAGVDPLQVTAGDWAKGTGVQVVRAFGIHPQAIQSSVVTAQLDALAELLSGADVVAMGEIGLDDREGMPPAGLQEMVLQTQLQLAKHLCLPVIFHCVGRIGRLRDVLREFGPLPAGGMIHGFGGPAEMVNDFKKLGLYFSFGGLVTHAHNKKCQKAAAKIPTDRLLVESDTPDHTPAGADASEPAAITETLRALSGLRRESPEALGRITAENARRLFGLTNSE